MLHCSMLTALRETMVFTAGNYAFNKTLNPFRELETEKDRMCQGKGHSFPFFHLPK